jgi:hypothetical protein
MENRKLDPFEIFELPEFEYNRLIAIGIIESKPMMDLFSVINNDLTIMFKRDENLSENHKEFDIKQEIQNHYYCHCGYYKRRKKNLVK